MARLVVELGFGSTVTTPVASITWTEVTGRADMVRGVSISNRGTENEQSETQPSTCSLTLDNEDGALTAGRASSPYYPDVRKGVPLRVREITTAKNLITNTGFETDTSGWSSSGTPAIARVTSPVQHGTGAMRCTWGAVSSQSVRTDVYGLDVGTTYTASAYVRVPAGDQAVRLKLATRSTGTDFAFGSYSTTNDAWERVTVTFVATEPSLQLRINPQTPTGAGDIAYVDAVQLEEGATATAFDPDGAQFHPRFFGGVNGWPTQWSGLHATAAITATDVFKTLSRGSLETMLSQEVLLDGPLGYYPLTEADDSSAAGDLSGTTAGTLAAASFGTGGELSFGGGADAGPDGQGALTLTPPDASNGKYLTGDLGQTFETRSSSAFIFVEGWFSTSTNNRVICGLTSTDNRYQIVFSLNGSGLFQIQSTRTGEALTSSAPSTGNLADGAQHHFVYDEEAGTVWVDGVDYAVGVDLMYRLRHLTVGSWVNGRMWNGQLSHLAFYAPGPSGDIAQYVGHYTTGSTLHIGETGAARAARIASYVGATVSATGGTFGGIGSQAGLGTSALQHLQDVAAAEGGILIADRASGTVILQSRDVRYNPSPAISLAHADLDTDQVRFDDDDQKLVNIATGTRPGGATQRVSNQDSIDAYGPYPKSLTLVKETDNEVADALQWLVNRFADPPPEMRQVPVDAYTLPLATYRALLDADVSTALAVTGLPGEAAASSATVTIEGYTEIIRTRQHYISFHVSRAETDAVWVLNSSTYSQLDQTTRLAY
ncbi:carbohydrate binding domain-containing protein [Streptomyces sp. HNM0645]|uniref:phage head spike fiber domain-containing protein n=1 Tax=Streptomyces sp. HNM0645 TaxID=2782343 RepID=UPI0024B69C89|nr:carbohydrate binding domain-containing protein [Streptomyces sp. HNM0645]MDI9885898.1 carbohydrate binding domain-containing protein [Streptomyces sp. HNM0645]